MDTIYNLGVEVSNLPTKLVFSSGLDVHVLVTTYILYLAGRAIWLIQWSLIEVFKVGKVFFSSHLWSIIWIQQI